MKPRSIMLVDDNESDVELTRRALAKNGITNPLIVVEDGQAALDYLTGTGSGSDHRPGELPAFVLLDLKLPKVDGLGVLRSIRAEPLTRRLPVVILTTSNEGQDLASGYDLGVNSYIRKPVNFDQFTVTIEKLAYYWLVLNEPSSTAQNLSLT